MFLPFVQGPQWITAPGRVGRFPCQGGGLRVGYGACQPNSKVSSIPTTSLKLPFRMPSNFNLVINIEKKIAKTSNEGMAHSCPKAD